MKAFDYFFPKTLDEAREILIKYGKYRGLLVMYSAFEWETSECLSCTCS